MCLWMGGLSRCFLHFDVVHHDINAFATFPVNHDIDLSSDDIPPQLQGLKPHGAV